MPAARKTCPEALYRVIAAEIRDQIRKGTLRPGQIVEGRVVLARRLQVSAPTVQRALELLEEEGFVQSYKYRGTFVTGAEPEFPVPLYMRVVNDIVHDLKIGLLKPGDMLLTEVDLAEAYGYSERVISRAFGVLQDRGLVRVELAIGTIVADGVPRDTRPKYVMAREFLTRDIKAGVFPVGSRLPTRAELAARYSVGRKAFDRVMAELRDQGVIRTDSSHAVIVLREPD